MTIIAKRSVQLKGHIYSKGEAAEWEGPIDSRMAANFVAKDGKDLTVTPPPEKKEGGAKGDKGAPGDKGEPTGEEKNTLERIDKLLKQLGVKGIKQKLDDLNVSYPPKMSDSQLALLLLQQQGEV